MASTNSKRALTSPRTLLVLSVMLGLFACITRMSDAPPQGWWAERGPVVPHDSFPSDCSLCHTGDDWHTIHEDFTYDHAAETGVALDGAHARAECLRCHNDRGPVAIFAVRGCAGCHEDVHLSQLGTDCGSCHGEQDWRAREEIVRHEQTRFPLVGAHAAVACWRCHAGAEVGQFTPVDTECIGCHTADFARASDPDHDVPGFGTECDTCHLPTTWRGAGFIHASWPLTGAHRTLACDACHGDGNYGGTSTDCYSCHVADYDTASDPDHVAGGFPTDCLLCHGTFSWEGASFDHSWVTGACADCHMDDYLGTTDPNHQDLGFSTSCEDCHVTTSWDATFDHSGTAGRCADCHMDEYLATTDPNHQNSGFPTSCDDCHGTNTWNDATFDHDFPINGGDHGGFDCTDCHLNPTDYSTFSCTHCHDHRQSEMDSEHDEVQDYVWETSACYSCHPDGRD